jgi:hypothetical protein
MNLLLSSIVSKYLSPLMITINKDKNGKIIEETKMDKIPITLSLKFYKI